MGKILVVEDDRDIREVVTIILESENYSVVTFANVSDFMNRDMNEVPDLFILDVMLPDGSGIEVCGDIKSQCTLSKAPVIIMSAHATVDRVTNGCDAEGFVQKPFDIDFFLSQVKIHISNSAS